MIRRAVLVAALTAGMVHATAAQTAGGRTTVLAPSARAATAAPFSTAAWDTSVTLGDPFVPDARVMASVDTTGRVLVVHGVLTGDAANVVTSTRVLSWDPATPGAPAGIRTLAGNATAIARSGTHAVALLRTLELRGSGRGTGRAPVRLQVSALDSRGRVARSVRIADVANTGGSALAANERGTVVVAWVDHASGSHSRVRARVRPRSGSDFGPSVLLGSAPSVHGLAATVGPRGAVAVTWAVDAWRGRRVRRVIARVRRSPSGFGPSLVVGRHDGYAQLQAAFGGAPRDPRDGPLHVVWGSQDLGGPDPRLPYVVRANVLAPGARAFAREQTLDTSTRVSSPVSTVLLRAAPDGGAVAAWNAVDDTFAPVRVARASAAGAFAPAVTLDDGRPAPGSILAAVVLSDLAVAAGGTAVTSWTRTDVPPPTASDVPSAKALTATQRPGDAFSATELLPGTGAPTLAFDPSGNRLAALWVERAPTDTTAVPLPPVQLHLATRLVP